MKSKKFWKKLLVFALTCVMVCATAIPVFAARVSHEKRRMNYRILYVDNSFYVGYNYGAKWQDTYTCAYSEPHSDSDSGNHSIYQADIKAQLDTANKNLKTDKDWEIVGWAKTASANPRVIAFKDKYSDSDTTAVTPSSDTIYFVAKVATPPAPTTFDVVYHSVDNPDGRKVTENISDVSGIYNALNGLNVGYLYGGTFSDADCTSAYDFANGENGMGFTPKAGETYHVWELEAKYLAPRNYLIWRIVESGSSRVHVSELYMLFALDRLNYREAGFDVDVDESGGGSLLSLGANRKSIYQGDANKTKIAFETIDVIRPDKTLEDYIYVKDGVIKNTRSGYVVNEPDRDPGYIVLSQLNAADFAAFSAKAGNSVSYVPYYVTVDGIRVTGDKMRTCGYRGEGLGEKFKSIDWEDKPVDSKATPIATSRLNLFSSRNGIMSSAGSFSVENGGVEENVPQKPVFGKKMNRR